MSDHDSIWSAVAKTFGAIAAWIGIHLAQIQGVVAILSGLVVAGYAATQWYYLWRDRRDKARQK